MAARALVSGAVSKTAMVSRQKAKSLERPLWSSESGESHFSNSPLNLGPYLIACALVQTAACLQRSA